MNHLITWLGMGGYSQYVWGAYGLAGFVLIANVLLIKRQRVTTRKRLQLWFKR